jgi:hypothetical protein
MMEYVPKLDKLTLTVLSATDRVDVSLSSIFTVAHYGPHGVSSTRELSTAAQSFTQSCLKLQLLLILSYAQLK